MSIFAKKPEWEQKVMAEVGTAPQIVPKTGSGKGGGYGIAEAIQLLRSLPAEQSSELVVRVVRATLASLDVHLADIVEDATRKQKHLADRVASEHAQIAELERQLETRRREIAALEADLKETTSVKERLQQAEKTAVLASGPPRAPRGTPVATTTLMGGHAPAETSGEISGHAAAHTPGPELLARAAREEPTVRSKD
jgi:TolA-binding protein